MKTALAIFVIVLLLLRGVPPIWYLGSGRIPQAYATSRVFWIASLFFTIVLALLFWYYGAFSPL